MIPHRPTIAEIDLDAVRFNYEQLRKKVGKETKMLAVVKADGYGHGATFISKELQRLGVDLLGVAISEEGISLRKAGIRKPIIILNGVFKGQIKETIEYNLTPVIFDSNTAQRLSDEGKRVNKRVKIHVKIDTGMGRVGILPKDIMPFFSKLKDMSNLEVEGVLSHLSTASGDSSEDLDFTSLQLKRFEKCIREIDIMGFSPPLRHIANSAATIDLPPSFCNVLRPGLMLYGAYPSFRFAEKIHLKPVMSLKTEIMQIKSVPAGYSISYKRTFVTQRDSVIATLPIGYADGYNRLLSNRGAALIGGEKAPVVGTVCMDMTMVDVTKVPNVHVGDEAVLIGRQGDKEISADEIADKIGTISYEVFCGVSKRVPRIYIKNGKIIGKKTDG
ncbi:MAG: alanine racemase [Deltaproteobacteria bacterium CG12_big_fil_rev_8_21_14_0_65_43_10]|nr:MAG: alanine racemase [Deltaproteobacteria bacterium CG12_big_fil_rev_8_21_14_0_65_43_10]PIU84827.1 MAG: alanine racemase [Deltaproteobacteria bacterium CG06_land_8_20_14_3_00_44_19]PIX22594.1 MAG: alanine racemase [Deltaproteobacteria bacterium CG_4_8_14_3_um_filter_43_13]PIZ18910.1 MAG: alanine racemase [Deltaproteobacteria bacterium CG_4_10_14_0_8_um_filter_43_12]PJB46162.1 MAG: alanine racemase [Deltaproteobacteria bacterium CG_4_9_14_3_um_filter_44_9]HCX89858.1 alanine racemase [Deltap